MVAQDMGRRYVASTVAQLQADGVAYNTRLQSAFTFSPGHSTHSGFHSPEYPHFHDVHQSVLHYTGGYANVTAIETFTAPLIQL